MTTSSQEMLLFTALPPLSAAHSSQCQSVEDQLHLRNI